MRLHTTTFVYALPFVLAVESRVQEPARVRASAERHPQRQSNPGIAVSLVTRGPPAAPEASAAVSEVEFGDFEFRDERGRRDRPIHVWFARPRDVGPDSRVLFVLHGDSRTGQIARDSIARRTEARRFIVVAPQFRQAEYPGEAYDLGGMVDSSSELQPRADWALLLIEHLFHQLRERWSLTSTSYDIIGHSAGGQFVQRLVLFVPEARFRRAVASGPGTVAVPDETIDAPYGLRGVSLPPRMLETSLTRDFVLVVGERDIAEGARPRVVLEQGKTRVSRAFRLFAIAHEAAVERGVPLTWRLRVVPKLDHSPMENLAIDVEEVVR